MGEHAEHQVAIAGGGPTGLMLAAELALAGVDVVIVERRADQSVPGSRAGGLYARTLEVLDQRGVAQRFVDAGTVHPAEAFAGIMLDVTDVPSRHNYVLALWQSQFEPILADWVAELGVATRREVEVTGFAQDRDGVDVAISDGTTLRAQHLVGCDGGRSTVRKAAGIDFVGLDPSTSWLIAEVEMDDEPEAGMRYDRDGAHGMNRMGPDGPVRLVITEAELATAPDPSLEEVRAGLLRVYGTDFGLRSARWTSRFTDLARQAATYRAGRVLVAGDAAHVHSPHGGQGLNTGVQDAVNLGWKLALVVQGAAPDSLLDTYEAERHPVAARVLHNTQAQVALSRGDERSRALKETMADLLAMDEPRRHVAAMLAALDLRYDLGEGHPLLGRRLPDLDLETVDGPTTAYALLHEARPLLLDLRPSDQPPIGAGAWAGRVRTVRASCDGPWALPVLGEVDAPASVLVRPDGHVAWVGDGTDAGLDQAMARWFGPAPTA